MLTVATKIVTGEFHAPLTRLSHTAFFGLMPSWLQGHPIFRQVGDTLHPLTPSFTNREMVPKFLVRAVIAFCTLPWAVNDHFGVTTVNDHFGV